MSSIEAGNTSATVYKLPVSAEQATRTVYPKQRRLASNIGNLILNPLAELPGYVVDIIGFVKGF